MDAGLELGAYWTIQRLEEVCDNSRLSYPHGAGVVCSGSVLLERIYSFI